MRSATILFGLTALLFGCEAAAPPAPRAPSSKPRPKAYVVDRQFCRNGDKDCTPMGELASAKLTGPEQERLLAVWQNECSAGVATACGRAGNLLFLGTRIAHDPARGILLLEQGCKGDDETSCVNLSVHLHRGEGTAKNEARARALVETWCPSSPAACFNLAQYLQQAKTDTPRVITLLEKSCNDGLAEGCEALADVYVTGIAPAPTPTRVVELLATACERGGKLGCHNLALRLSRGKDIPKDAPRATALLTANCERGFGPSCSTLAMRQHKGEIESGGMTVAELLARGCELGDPLGCKTLAGFYETGGPVQPDPARATELRARGCQLGDTKQCEH